MAEYQLTIFLWLNRKKNLKVPDVKIKVKARYDNSKNEIKIHVIVLREQSRTKHGYFKIL